MATTGEAVTLTLPRAAIGGVLSLVDDLNERMHQLLERNTDGALSSVERAELETLVQMAHFGQMVSMALQSPTNPTTNP